MRAGRIFPPHRLPPGFLATLQNPPVAPPVPRPSATLALLRNGAPGLEILLLKRSPRSGFIPGAWVFPGGTIDPSDADPDIFRESLSYSEAMTGFTVSLIEKDYS